MNSVVKYLSIVAALWISAIPVNAGYLDQLAATLRPDASGKLKPLDALYFDLAIDYEACAVKFQLADVQRDVHASKNALSDGKQCQGENISKGDAAIRKLKTDISKPSALAALKELNLYWRLQMSEIMLAHSERDGLNVLQNLRSHIERVRLESDW